MKDPDHSIKIVRIINFDIIHHECRGQLLKNSYKYYQTLKENKLSKYQEQPKKSLLDAAFRNQGNTKQGIYFEKNVVKKHFRTPFSAAAKKRCLKIFFSLG